MNGSITITLEKLPDGAVASKLGAVGVSRSDVATYLLRTWIGLVGQAEPALAAQIYRQVADHLEQLAKAADGGAVTKAVRMVTDDEAAVDEALELLRGKG